MSSVSKGSEITLNIIENSRSTTGTKTRVPDISPVNGMCPICVEDCNVLCLGGKTHGELALQEMLRVWLSTPFEGGKYQKRLDKITAIEQRCC